MEPFPEGMGTIMFGEMAQSHIFLLRFTQCGVCPIGLWLLACLGRKKTSEPFIVLAGVFLSAVLMCRHGLFLGRRETFLGSSAGLLHTGGLCRQFHTQPKLLQSLFR